MKTPNDTKLDRHIKRSSTVRLDEEDWEALREIARVSYGGLMSAALRGLIRGGGLFPPDVEDFIRAGAARERMPRQLFIERLIWRAVQTEVELAKEMGEAVIQEQARPTQVKLDAKRRGRRRSLPPPPAEAN